MSYAKIAVGSYLASYNSDTATALATAGKGTGEQALGVVEEVYLWQRRYQAKIVQSNLQGNFPLDAIYQGGECFCCFTLKEWTPAIQAMLWPMSSDFDAIGTVGSLLSSYAGELKFTVEPNSTAAELGPATVRFGKAIVAEDQMQDILLGNVQRNMKLVLRCFPYKNGASKQVWFETT